MKKEFFNQMKAVVFYREELEFTGMVAPGAKEFWESLILHEVAVLCISKKDRYGFAEKLRQNGYGTQEAAAIGATDAAIDEAGENQIAVFAYRNPCYPEESLMNSPVLVEDFDGVDFAFAERIWRRYHRLPWTILSTERCTVRELTLEDLDELFAMYGQEHMTEYMEPLYSRAEEEAYQKAYIEQMYGFYGYGMWLVFDRETKALIGRAGLENRELHGVYILELGYAVAVPYQRKGYAYEVCSAIIAYAKEHLEYRELNCLIQTENRASAALARKLGFVRTETILEDEQLFDRYTCTW